MKHKKIWIALVKVNQASRRGPLGNADQAYSIVVGLSASKGVFRSMVKRELASLDLQLLRMEDAEPLEERQKSRNVHRDIVKLAKSINQGAEIAFDVFATFDRYEEGTLTLSSD